MPNASHPAGWLKKTLSLQSIRVPIEGRTISLGERKNYTNTRSSRKSCSSVVSTGAGMAIEYWKAKRANIGVSPEMSYHNHDPTLANESQYPAARQDKRTGYWRTPERCRCWRCGLRVETLRAVLQSVQSLSRNASLIYMLAAFSTVLAVLARAWKLVLAAMRFPRVAKAQPRAGTSERFQRCSSTTAAARRSYAPL